MWCTRDGGCDDGATTGQSWVLVISNIAFLFPIVMAWRRRFYRQFAYLIVTMLVSAAYHLCAGDIACFGTKCAVWRRVDNLFAYTLIVVVALVIVQFESLHNSVYVKQRVRKRSSGRISVRQRVADVGILVALREFILFAVIATNAVMTVHDPGDAHIAVFNVVAVVFIVLVKLVWEWTNFSLHIHNYFLVAVATFLAVGGIVLFYEADHRYWLLHSFWHIGIALAIGVLFWAMDGIEARPQCVTPTDATSVSESRLNLLHMGSQALPFVSAVGRVSNV